MNVNKACFKFLKFSKIYKCSPTFSNDRAPVQPPGIKQLTKKLRNRKFSFGELT